MLYAAIPMRKLTSLPLGVCRHGDEVSAQLWSPPLTYGPCLAGGECSTDESAFAIVDPQCWFKHEAPTTALQAGAPAFVPSVARPSSSASDAVMASPVASTSNLPAPAIEEDDVGTCNICFEPPFRFGLLGETVLI